MRFDDVNVDDYVIILDLEGLESEVHDCLTEGDEYRVISRDSSDNSIKIMLDDGDYYWIYEEFFECLQLVKKQQKVKTISLKEKEPYLTGDSFIFLDISHVDETAGFAFEYGNIYPVVEGKNDRFKTIDENGDNFWIRSYDYWCLMKVNFDNEEFVAKYNEIRKEKIKAMQKMSLKKTDMEFLMSIAIDFNDKEWFYDLATRKNKMEV